MAPFFRRFDGLAINDGRTGFRFTPDAILGFRIFAWATLGLLFVWFVLRPLLRRVTDEQVALYLEEHEPTLEAAILGAVAARDAAGADPARATVDDLREIGVPVGPRRRFLTAAAPLASPAVDAGGPDVARMERAAAAPELRTMSVMFCDLVGSTELAGRLDPEDLGPDLGQGHLPSFSMVSSSMSTITTWLWLSGLVRRFIRMS